MPFRGRVDFKFVRRPCLARGAWFLAHAPLRDLRPEVSRCNMVRPWRGAADLRMGGPSAPNCSLSRCSLIRCAMKVDFLCPFFLQYAQNRTSSRSGNSTEIRLMCSPAASNLKSRRHLSTLMCMFAHFYAQRLNVYSPVGFAVIEIRSNVGARMKQPLKRDRPRPEATDAAVSPERSRLMARVRGKDTKPKMVVRRLAHALGYRFRLHRRDLPGSPGLRCRPPEDRFCTWMLLAPASRLSEGHDPQDASPILGDEAFQKRSS